MAERAEVGEPPTRKRRGRSGLKMVTGVVFAVLGVWFMASLGSALEISQVHDVDRFGTARVKECHRTPMSLWMTYVCEADVKWDRELLGKPRVSSTTIGSSTDLSGVVEVVSYRWAGRYGAPHYATVPVDRPRAPFSYGWWMFFIFVSLIPGYVAGWFVGKGIDRLLPEPKEKPKDWRGVSRRATPGMNGRRRKRNRG
ncbi:hypothetical protein ACFQ73_08155 [Amycolatopsis japonica]|uniref:hypothetical protein n=1 Tax=Amycolatopsis japonica TaxID=208439 RepID=UPI00366F4052